MWKKIILKLILIPFITLLIYLAPPRQETRNE